MKIRVLMGAVMLSALPFMAQAGDTVSGRIVGHDCVHKGETCPIDKLDPHLALERDFVLVSGGEYYFLPNLPRDTKVRYVLDSVQVKGELDKKHNAITVDELIVSNKTVWSPTAQRHAWGRLPGS